MSSTILSIPWPPPYKLTKHRRAKRVKLRVHPQHGLLITVPYRFNHTELPRILETHQQCIDKQLQRMQCLAPLELPDAITFHAFSQTWRIVYMPSTGKLKLHERASNELVLLGNVNNKNHCAKLL